MKGGNFSLYYKNNNRISAIYYYFHLYKEEKEFYLTNKKFRKDQKYTKNKF